MGVDRQAGKQASEQASEKRWWSWWWCDLLVWAVWVAVRVERVW
jgi:hypothetical protein